MKKYFINIFIINIFIITVCFGSTKTPQKWDIRLDTLNKIEKREIAAWTGIIGDGEAAYYAYYNAKIADLSRIAANEEKPFLNRILNGFSYFEVMLMAAPLLFLLLFFIERLPAISKAFLRMIIVMEDEQQPQLSYKLVEETHSNDFHDENCKGCGGDSWRKNKCLYCGRKYFKK